VKLTVVGCAGTFPGPLSPCSSYLIEHDGFRLVFDMGSGALSNLGKVGDLLDVDAVIVSHLHGDHCLDLVGYAYARRYDPRGVPAALPVFGPATIWERIASSFDKRRPEMVDDIYDMNETDGSPMDIGPFRIEMVRTNHPIECYAIRASAGGRTITYSADTGICPEVIDLARGSDLFLCEASYEDGVANPPGVHLTGSEAGEHATKAEIDRLVITHHVPWNDLDQTMEAAAGTFHGELTAALPCATYEV
jgi:ribonuclease BN (tRNA processing enzyme)